MKQAENSGTTKDPRHVSPPSEDKNRSFVRSLMHRKNLIKVLSAAAGVILIVVIYFLANRKEAGNANENIPVPIKTDRVVEIEVIDGSGNLKAAQHVTNVLRVLGYDVVEMKRSNGGIIERSYIFDRSGDMNIAHKVAASLGIPEDKVFQKIDYNLYLDVSVVVGKDFSKLKIFQSLNKGEKI